jgi:hypothetical protein
VPCQVSNFVAHLHTLFSARNKVDFPLCDLPSHSEFDA